MKKASKYQYENFRRRFDLKNPVVQEEIDFLRYPQDLVALGGSDHGWLFHKFEEANSRFFTDKARPLLPSTRCFEKMKFKVELSVDCADTAN